MLAVDQSRPDTLTRERPKKTTAVAHETSPYDADPAAVMEAIELHDGPVCVDLDETLYLRNSTEDFIDLARPGLLALILLRALDTLRPWRWTGGAVTRDAWRVGLIWIFFPWTRLLWRARVPKLAQKFANRPLIAALRRKGTTIVVITAGFHPIVRPLVAALGFPDARIIAARVASFADRRNGKLHAALSALGAKFIGSSLFVTDSLDDRPLLSQCACPLRTIWPDARYRRALSGVYFPGEYLSLVKRPGERYISRVILQEDLAFWVLTSIALAAHPLAHLAGLAFLMASFWTIYERGYVDNDWIAAHFEQQGKVSQSYWQAPVPTPTLKPWIWATALGAVAVSLLSGAAPPFIGFLKWEITLVCVFSIFSLYNRIDKSTRVWLFAALQLARSAAFLVLVPVPSIGAMGLAALALARWVPYYMYRLANGKWPDLQPNLLRLLFFLVLAAILAASGGAEAILNYTAAATLIWNVFRARSELIPMLKQARWLERRRN